MAKSEPLFCKQLKNNMGGWSRQRTPLLAYATEEVKTLWEKEDKKELQEMLVKLDEIEDEEEREYYKDLLTKWYEVGKKKERNWMRKRDFRNFDMLDSPEILEKEKYKPSVITRLHRKESFEETLFSQKSEDLRELVSDGTLSLIIDGLTPKQREVLFYVGVWKYSAREIGEAFGVSERNIRKIYKTALYHIRGKIYPIIKFRRKLETGEKYKQIAREKGIQTIHSERKFVETADNEVRNYYGKMTNE